MLLLHSTLWRAAVAAFTLCTTPLGVTTVTVTDALPNIAPICAVNQLGSAAVRGPHVNNATRTVKSGSLAAGGFAVFVDSVALNASTVRTIEAGKAIRMFVRSATLLPNSTTPDKSFRGLHVLLAVNSGAVNVSNALVPVSPFVKSPNCTSTFISGISHAEPTLKTGMLANLQVNAAFANITLDVNLVVSNNNVSGSTFYFTQYKLASVVKKGDTAPSAPKAPTVAAAPVATAPKAAASPTAPVIAAAPQGCERSDGSSCGRGAASCRGTSCSNCDRTHDTFVQMWSLWFEYLLSPDSLRHHWTTLALVQCRLREHDLDGQFLHEQNTNDYYYCMYHLHLSLFYRLNHI
jgi:hypothetical protein